MLRNGGDIGRRGRILAPAGMMWSVVMLSPTLSSTLASMDSARGTVAGKGLMLGPRRISTSSMSSAGTGGTIKLSLMRKDSGIPIFGISPRVRGSVNTPARADAAAVSGLTRYTWASAVPDRPSKLRLKVRREMPPELGDWPIPMQGPQAHSRMRAPAAIRSARAPFSAKHAQHLLGSRRDGQADVRMDGLALEDGGNLEHIVEGGIGAGTDAALIYLDRPDLLHCLHRVGRMGQAASGRRAERSMFTTSSYSASLSGPGPPSQPPGPGPS